MNDVEAYVAEVRAALADLPPQVRDELLEDLPEHLAEVAAEGHEPQGAGPEGWGAGTSLRSRLGSPVQYAAELRATVELGHATGRSPIGLRWAAAVEAARGRLRTADVRLGPLLGYAKASDYLRLLRPGWWLLRGYLAAMAVVYAMDFPARMGLLPRIGGSVLAALVVLAGFVVGSIWLGRNHGRLPQWARRALGVASVVLVLVAISGFARVDSDTRSGGGYYQVVDNNPYGNVRDVFSYDSHGRLLRDVRLFDQDGNPVVLGFGDCETHYVEPTNVYPRCPELAPFTVPGTSPSPTPIPTATAIPTPTATPTPATPTPATPSATR